jgi:AcrR family transcriptional regulator
VTLTAKGRATRQRIIEGAARHIRSDEPGEVTLDDIRAVTSTSKSQLFHYFPGGKEELLLTVARYEADRVLDDQQPELSALTSWAAWQRWRDRVVDRYRKQGRSCPLGALMAQANTTAGAAEVSIALLGNWEGYLRRGIEQMQAAGKIRREVDPAQAAVALIAAIQGGVQVLRTTGRLDHLEASLDVLLAYLRGA